MFRIKLSVQPENYKEVENELTRREIEIAEDAEYELIERVGGSAYLPVKDDKGDKLSIPIDDIIFLESFGRNIAIHTIKQIYTSNARMYQLEEQLISKGFLRVSNSIIIARKKIIRIRPTLSSKFVLTMEDSSLVDVTRSYYAQFRREFGI